MVATPSPSRGWTVREHEQFFESDAPKSFKHIVRTLERLCRGKPYCRATNEEIAEKARLTPSYVQCLLRRMEAAGLIRRVMDPDSRGTVRLGIVLCVRADPDRPAGDTPERLETAVDALTQEARGGRALFEGGGSKSARPPGCKSARPLLSVFKESCRKESLEESKEAGPRPRLSEPPSAPVPPPPAPRPPAPPPADPPADVDAPAARPAGGEPSSPAPELTAHQRAWLDGLAPDRRARFEGLSPGRRGQLLELFRHGADRIALTEAETALGKPPPPPPPRAEASLQELLESLRGRYGPSMVPRVARAIMTALGDHEQSWGPVHQLVSEAAAGVRPIESLAVPLAKILAAIEGGKEYGNTAATWMKSVQNFDRERLGAARKKPAFGSAVQKYPEGRPRPDVRSMDHCTQGATPCQR